MKISISQSNFLPWKGYFDLIGLSDIFIIYDDMQYTHSDWRNRNIIKTSNGPVWLTIPIVKKGRIKNSISETKIANKDWIKKHLKTIEYSYKKSKFYESNFDFIQEMYSEFNTEYLSELNTLSLKKICKFLKIKTSIYKSSEFIIKGDRNEKLINICKQVGATTYLSSPKARNYLNSKLFKDNGIEIEYISYRSYNQYEQLWGDFVHKVSIIDMIFNCGNNIHDFMQIGYQ